MLQKQKVIFIVGPTATGKSELAVKLAKKIRAEIISADSMSIYRGMDIISSKPDKNLRKQAPHHLIDIITSDKEYNVAKFIKESNKKIKEIIKRKKAPIIVGGSGLYIDGLLYGVFRGTKSDATLRAKLEQEAKKYGSHYLYEKLKVIDPEAAEKIHPNNLRRIIRALEVCILSKEKFSEIKRKRSGLIDIYDIELFGLGLDRDKLYSRIDARVDKMFRRGLISEVKHLLKKKLAKTACQALGIKEVEGLLKGQHDLERAKYLLKRNTRHFAKRQITWFKRNKQIVWLDADRNRNKLAGEIIKRIVCIMAFLLIFSNFSYAADDENKAYFWRSEKGVVEMKLEIDDFTHNQNIPSQYTCDGEDVSPAISWSSLPESTRSLALSVIDPDAPMGDFVHWLIYDIPKEAGGIPKGGPLPKGAKEVRNDFGKSSYGGPCPPSGAHRYFFALYALDVEHLNGVTSADFLEKVKKHAIASAEVIGLYSRRKR